MRKIQKPYGLQTFVSFLCGGTRLSPYWEPQEAEHAPLSLVTSARTHLSPVFTPRAKNDCLVSFRGKKRSHGRRETGPKLGILKTPLCAHSPLQICVSHINSIDDIENTRRRVKKAGYGFECEKEKWCRTGKAANRFYHTPQQTLWRLKREWGGSCFKWAQFATNSISFEHSSVVSTEPQNIIA